MTEENKIELKEETCKCFCQSKAFRKFLTIALGTFVGVFCALSLFAALHKPPVPTCPYHKMMRPPIAYHQFHKCPHRYHGDFHKKFERRDMKPPVRVNVEGDRVDK